MPTFPHWEATVLEHCYDAVDYISLHQYHKNHEDDLSRFLAASVAMDRYIDSVIATCDFMKTKLRSRRTMMLSFDEWNVWFHSDEAYEKRVPWQLGPHLLEDVYTMEDALVVGCLINSLLRHADRVKIACMAQLVNVIAPIMTENGGLAWRQTIYWPLLYASRHGRGVSMDVKIDSPSYESKDVGDVPYLDASSVLSGDGTSLCIFCVNRSKEPVDLGLRVAGLGEPALAERVELRHDDLKATNTAMAPHRVVPKSLPVSGEIRLAPLSYNFLRYAVGGVRR
jgi:alpha-N-arabinofuranosidase